MKQLKEVVSDNRWIFWKVNNGWVLMPHRDSGPVRDREIMVFSEIEEVSNYLKEVTDPRSI